MARQRSDDTPGRVERLRLAYQTAKANDPRLLPWLVLPAVGVLAVLVVVGVLIGLVVYMTVLGVLGATAVATTIFGRRATRVMFAQAEGQPGAAAGLLQGMRGAWKVTPAVQFNRQQEMVHRALGRPGVVLVGEGTSAARVGQLLLQERRRIGRVAPDTPVYEFQVGPGPDQLDLRTFQTKVVRLPRNLKPAEVTELEQRLRALGANTPPIPKGPMPKSLRMPRGRMR